MKKFNFLRVQFFFTEYGSTLATQALVLAAMVSSVQSLNGLLCHFLSSFPSPSLLPFFQWNFLQVALQLFFFFFLTLQ